MAFCNPCSMPPVTRTRYLAWILAAQLILLDQIGKALVLDAAAANQLPIEVTSFFNIVLVYNRGISFGMLGQHPEWMPILLTVATSAIVLVLAVWLARAPEKPVVMALGMVIGGAVGNIIDRIRVGAVVDFLDFHVAGYHWPAFNLADSAIFLGVVILLMNSIVSRPKESTYAQP